MMFAPVQPVQAERSRHGLVAWALTPAQEDMTWTGGMAWRPERCTSARSYDSCSTGDVSEVQSVSITGGPTGGTFTLTYSGQTTAGIAYNAAAAAVQAALVALSNVAPGDVTVGGGPGPGTPWTVTFRRELGNVGQMTANAAGLTGGSSPAVNVATTTPGFTMFGPTYGPGQSDVVYYRPIVARVEDECYARSSDPADDLARVRRQLESVTSWLVARELWTGDASDANPYSVPGEAGSFVNARLTGGVGVRQLTGVHDPLHALGALEQAARGELGALGMDVWIHMPITLLPYVDAGIVREGAGLFTKAGARVIADAGYTGSDPDNVLQAGEMWMYATGPVQVRLSPMQTLQETDHSRNVVQSIAERVYAATFDPCVHFGVAVDLPATS
jgi:hypothetical protein